MYTFEGFVQARKTWMWEIENAGKTSGQAESYVSLEPSKILNKHSYHRATESTTEDLPLLCCSEFSDLVSRNSDYSVGPRWIQFPGGSHIFL